MLVLSVPEGQLQMFLPYMFRWLQKILAGCICFLKLNLLFFHKYNPQAAFSLIQNALRTPLWIRNSWEETQQAVQLTPCTAHLDSSLHLHHQISERWKIIHASWFCGCLCMNTHTHTYTHTYTINTHTHTHTHTRVRVSIRWISSARGHWTSFPLPVKLLVSQKAWAPAEVSLASATGVRLLTCVGSPVFNEVGVLTEFFSTFMTGKGLLSCVSSLVCV